MVKEKLMIKLTKNNKTFNYTPNKIHPINSTHYDQETRLYEIWDDEYFVIHKHSPWIDDKILNNQNIINDIITYTQQSNRIVEVYHISEQYIVTKFYKDYYPCLIKSSVMFYDYETYLKRSNAHYEYFKDFSTSKTFYQNILKEYRDFHKFTNCFFKDDGANNFIVNDDHSDYKILDFGCLRHNPDKEIRVRNLLDGIGGVNGNDDMHIFGKQNFTQKEHIVESWKKTIKTTFQMHIMWYESEMVNETLDSLKNALQYANGEVNIEICLNSQTYLEKPEKGKPSDMFNTFLNHDIISLANITYKTDDDPFYNIADWRREKYNTEGYTIWGESDCLLPYDLFFILEQLQLSGQLIDPHTISLSSRKMWDDTWKEVELKGLENIAYKDIWGEILHRKTQINQQQLDEINDNQSEVEIIKLSNNKIDGALFILSENLPQFIPNNMNFVREDSCAQYVFEHSKIPQYHIKNRVKGHNYHHSLKRTNTQSTRDDEIFKQYADKSTMSMNKFLNNLKNG